MLSRQRQWRARQKRAAARKPRVRVDSVEISPLEKTSGYGAVIHGFNLHAVISPPRVTVGEVRLEKMEFSRDGRTIRGRLSRAPRGQAVVIDYGFVRAELGARPDADG